jgi:hypothetical protein
MEIAFIAVALTFGVLTLATGLLLRLMVLLCDAHPGGPELD